MDRDRQMSMVEPIGLIYLFFGSSMFAVGRANY